MVAGMFLQNLRLENVLGSAVGAGLGAFIVAFLALFLVLAIAVYVYVALALMTLAKKLKVKNQWLAWIPIANVYLVVKMAKQNGWWTLIVLAPFVPFFGKLAFLAVGVWFFWIIAERRNYPGWISLFMLIPVVNFVILGILAWGKKN